MSDSLDAKVALWLAGVVGAKILQLRANPDHAACFRNWIALRDPVGVQLWRRHWPRELGLAALAALALYLIVEHLP
jgi:hypothetical protein